MPKYVIERELPGAGQLSADELHAIAGKSNAVVAGMNGRVQWQHSYVTEDKLYCVYIAENKDAVREHAEIGGFPCNNVTRVSTMFDPVTGE
jgi:hypothetical protein